MAQACGQGMAQASREGMAQATGQGMAQASREGMAQATGQGTAAPTRSRALRAGRRQIRQFSGNSVPETRQRNDPQAGGHPVTQPASARVPRR